MKTYKYSNNPLDRTSVANLAVVLNTGNQYSTVTSANYTAINGTRRLFSAHTLYFIFDKVTGKTRMVGFAKMQHFLRSFQTEPTYALMGLAMRTFVRWQNWLYDTPMSINVGSRYEVIFINK